MAGINDLLVALPPIQTGAMSKYVASEALKKRFTVMSRFGDVIKLWDESTDGKHLFLPRAVCPPAEVDMRVDGYPITVESFFKPRNAEQAQVVPQAAQLLKEGHSFIFEAPTGFGKTIVASALIAQIGVTTLVVCTKEDLIKQWRERLIKFTDLTSKDIGLIQQDVCDVYGKKVVLASVHSLAIPGRYPPGIRLIFGMIVFDECHRLGAETFSRVAAMFPARLRLGFSATPRRVDGKEIVFNAHIGPVRVRAKAVPMIPKVLRYQSGWTCPRWRVDGVVKPMPHSPGKAGHVLKYLFKDPVRNALIVHLCLKAWKAGRRNVVFSNTIDHLGRLESMCRVAGIPTSDMGRYYGALKGHQMDTALGKRLIFATPGKMGEGTDAPWLDCCTLACPLSNVEQIVGRVLREYPEKQQPVVFDILDLDSPVFKGYANRRQEYYSKVGAQTKEMSFDAP